MYEMTAQVHRRLGERGLKTGSDEFESAFDAEMEEQRKRVSGRLWAEVPGAATRLLLPDEQAPGRAQELVRGDRRGPRANDARARQDRPALRRSQVNQIISGAIGFDDWEWGVDLFADDPVVFKKLIYEMRFDEASAWYAEFGPFYVGLQFSPSELPGYLEGAVPALRPVP